MWRITLVLFLSEKPIKPFTSIGSAPVETAAATQLWVMMLLDREEEIQT